MRYEGYKVNKEIADSELPFELVEGEYKITVDHDINKSVLKRIVINGIDVSEQFSLQDQKRSLLQGLFEIRVARRNSNSKIKLKQYYWYYRVEILN